MDKEKELRFYKILENLLNTLSSINGFNREIIRKSAIELCQLFDLTKGSTEFYLSPFHEKNSIGEVITDYNTGEKSRIIVERRIVTPSMTVIKGSLWIREDAPDLPQDEIDKIDMVLRVILSFISRQRLQRVVEQLGFYDDFGYPNLRSFKRYIEQLTEQNNIIGHTAIHFNLKHFTLINQEIGRKGGDLVMHNFFDHITRLVGDNGIVCRVGGDNFVSIFKTEILNDVLDALRGTTVEYSADNSNRILISASVGVYTIPENYDPEASENIMDKITSASHTAKNGGKESVVFFNEQMMQFKKQRMRIQQLFPDALENEEFHVFYQPKIDIQNGSLVGAEALCRWFRDGKVVPPAEFIPVLERNTDICRLDFYMLDHVCQNIRRWLDEGRNVVRISVNLSRKHMIDVDLLQHILEIINRHNVPHEFIEIELTETTTDIEFRDLKRVVSGLQQEGIYTSVDDFGIGYSSLNLIRDIPWNVLKIDRSFLPLDGENADSTRSVMFKSVVSMAKELGLECIAEGVETKKQVEIMLDNNCLIAQGFFFDKPLPLEEFEKRLSHKNYDIDFLKK